MSCHFLLSTISSDTLVNLTGCSLRTRAEVTQRWNRITMVMMECWQSANATLNLCDITYLCRVKDLLLIPHAPLYLCWLLSPMYKDKFIVMWKSVLGNIPWFVYCFTYKVMLIAHLCHQEPFSTPAYTLYDCMYECVYVWVWVCLSICMYMYVWVFPFYCLIRFYRSNCPLDTI